MSRFSTRNKSAEAQSAARLTWDGREYSYAHDQRIVAERQWSKPKLAPKPQQPCDVGLFGDEHLQLDLVEMLQDPDPQ